MYNFFDSVLIQFNNSKILLNILNSFNEKMFVDRSDLLLNILDIDTAIGSQLDVIGRLVGATRQIYVNTVTTRDFGFDSTGFYGFDSPYGGTFDVKRSGSIFSLNDTAFRTLIKMTAFRNISNCSIGSLNYMLSKLFEDRGNAWVTQTDTLKISFNFDFELELYEKNLILNGYLPTPAGFSYNINEEIS